MVGERLPRCQRHRRLVRADVLPQLVDCLRIGGTLHVATDVADYGEQVAELKSKLQRISPTTDSDEFHSLLGDLVALEQYRRSLLDQAIGDTSGEGIA